MIPLNPSKQSISSRGFVSGLLRAVALLCLLGFAFRAHAEDAVPASACVFKDLKAEEACPAYSTTRAIEFLAMGEEAIIFLELENEAPIEPGGSKGANSQGVTYANAFDAKPTRTSVLASSRIEDSVLLEDIDEDDAMLLEREILELSGARYELPKTRAEIKKMIGFPESVDVASEDWIEMIRVHAQMTLSLSQNASVFLLEQMGLSASAVAAPTVAEPTAAPPVVAQPDSVEATAESPDSTAEIDVTNGTAAETPAAATNLQPASDELHPAVIETY
jgi:hypothetical protein